MTWSFSAGWACKDELLLLNSSDDFTEKPSSASQQAPAQRPPLFRTGTELITVNVVVPGLVETDMLAELGEERTTAFASQIPMGRIARPGEIAAVIGFLASEDAGYITGAVVPVDGGLAMGM